MLLSELTVCVIEQDASHHEKESCESDSYRERLREVSFLVLHLRVDLQCHRVAFECKDADAEKVRDSFHVERLESPLEAWLADLINRGGPNRADGRDKRNQCDQLQVGDVLHRA